MATELNPELADRQEYPYAVGVRMPSDERTTFTHFNTKSSASLFADLMDTSDNHVTLWVAIVEPEYMRSAVVPGWRQVTAFYL